MIECCDSLIYTSCVISESERRFYTHCVSLHYQQRVSVAAYSYLFNLQLFRCTMYMWPAICIKASSLFYIHWSQWTYSVLIIDYVFIIYYSLKFFIQVSWCAKTTVCKIWGASRANLITVWFSILFYRTLLGFLLQNKSQH